MELMQQYNDTAKKLIEKLSADVYKKNEEIKKLEDEIGEYDDLLCMCGNCDGRICNCSYCPRNRILDSQGRLVNSGGFRMFQTMHSYKSKY